MSDATKTSFIPGTTPHPPLDGESIKVGVVGGGSVGLVFGAYLQEHPKVTLTILSREGKVNQLLRYGGVVDCDGKHWDIGGMAAAGTNKRRNLKITALNDHTVERQDVLLICVKAQYVRECLDHIERLLAPHTVVVAAQNGIPFWLMHKGRDFLDGRVHEVPAVDPDGKTSRVLLPHVIGAVLQMAVAIDEPESSPPNSPLLPEVANPSGNVRVHGTTYKIVLGEPDDTMSPRLMAVGTLMHSVGLPVELTTRLRTAVWKKVLANVTMNPITSLTQRTIPDLCLETETRSVIQDTMQEVVAVCHKNGIDLGKDPVGDTMRLLANCYPNHKPSMRQDLDTGKRLEVDPIVTAVVQIAKCLQVKTPKLELLHALIASRDRAIAIAHAEDSSSGSDSPASAVNSPGPSAICRNQSDVANTVASTSSEENETTEGGPVIEMGRDFSMASIDLGTANNSYPSYWSPSPVPSRSASPRAANDTSGENGEGVPDLTMRVVVD